jgi:excisionase family DNA binding protein
MDSHDGQTGTANALLTEDEAAALLKVQPATLATWRVRGRPNLPFVRVGRCVRYRRQDLIAFINRQVRQSTSEVSA